FLWMSMSLMMVGRMGSEIGVSQNFGRGDKDSARGYAENALMLSIFLGIGYALLMALFADQWMIPFGMYGTPTGQAGSAYLRIASIGIPFTYITASLSGTFTGAGNSARAFVANAVGLVINIILDPLMILVWGWGVGGAAIATVIAQVVVGVLFLVFIKLHKQRPFPKFDLWSKLRMDKVRSIFRWSTPVVLENVIFIAMSMVVSSMISTGYGEEAFTAQRIGSQIESLSWLIGGGFASALTSFIGQNYGARKWARVHRGYKISLIGLLAWECVVTLLLIFCGRAMFMLFIDSPVHVVDMGEAYLKILAGCMPLMAFEGACAGAFRGVGQTVPPSICAVVFHLLRVPMCWLLGQYWGMYGIWLGVSISGGMRGLAEFIWYTIYSRKLPKTDETIAPEVAPV
ncbi:MATE family efflux transporter, partial [Eubacteriales bacterium OttesenSCG-928-N13]|nr:MATE family efflux transporter [Eubacteriales bacterium OttesenSCG-928-N13]